MSRYIPSYSAYKARFQNQLAFPFLTEPSPATPKREGPSFVLLHRQPKNFPKGWFALAQADPYGWRAKHYAQWEKKRKAAGLPHVIHNRIPDMVPPKKKVASVRAIDTANCREGTSAGNAVPGQLCAPRQMTA